MTKFMNHFRPFFLGLTTRSYYGVYCTIQDFKGLRFISIAYRKHTNIFGTRFEHKVTHVRINLNLMPS
jgi:hypothetical protein